MITVILKKVYQLIPLNPPTNTSHLPTDTTPTPTHTQWIPTGLTLYKQSINLLGQILSEQIYFSGFFS